MNDQTETGDFAGAVAAIFGETFADVMGLSARPSLRDTIEQAKAETGRGLGELTVLSAARDPYRLDTPKGHALGRWLADAVAEVLSPGERIHLRGLHYRLMGRITKPDGEMYTNTVENWIWVSETVAPIARWLGYLDFAQIRDARNAEPHIFTPDIAPPAFVLRAGEVELFLPETLEPKLVLTGDLGPQPYRHVIIAEKQGVEDLLLPVARRYKATLVLPSGEVSTTLLYDVMAAAAQDGRGVVIHQLGDADPAGWQMAASTARKAQALRDLKFPNIDVIVEAPALNPDQAAGWDLPSTPMKETEQRADRWKAATDREQTELDAAVALAGDELVKVVRKSIRKYWDPRIEERAREERARLEAEANARLADQLGPETLARIREMGEQALAGLQDEVAAINEQLTVDTTGIDMPDDPEPLDAELPAITEPPLFDSSWDWAEGTARLKARKSY